MPSLQVPAVVRLVDMQDATSDRAGTYSVVTTKIQAQGVSQNLGCLSDGLDCQTIAAFRTMYCL